MTSILEQPKHSLQNYESLGPISTLPEAPPAEESELIDYETLLNMALYSTTSQNREKTKRRNRILLILISIPILLSFVGAVTFYVMDVPEEKHLRNEVDELQTDIKKLQNELNELQQDENELENKNQTNTTP